uniref:alpha-1,2-fucosyltransferase n=1 Tax=Stappia sp. TaxID=1870903 RepID=UPI003BAC30D4
MTSDATRGKDGEAPAPLCLRVWGGLGNQMFQYAAGHAAARRLGTRLLIDPLEMPLDHAAMGLDLFGIEPEIWRPEGGGLLGRLRSGSVKPKKRHRLWPGPVFMPDSFCHADGYFEIGPGTYLAGYFQSERFFSDCEGEIRALFDLSRVAPTIEPALLAAANDPASVSVHVRRGDYMTNPNATSVHGLLGRDHYDRAMALAERLVPGATFVVFSDDIQAADDLTAHWPNRVLVRDQSREQDLFLMSRCAHHVTANSSFSWWGAWLGRNPERQVIAPRQWFARDELRKVYVDELFPRGWILI